ncbi:hypothetical protein F5Y04DRAFT_266880 [Hypomontagnella monticulosa]|nr:hypothetical protein F5Y04DRAFT_266880 [Hypomontagnella monticulosa]
MAAVGLLVVVPITEASTVPVTTSETVLVTEPAIAGAAVTEPRGLPKAKITGITVAQSQMEEVPSITAWNDGSGHTQTRRTVRLPRREQPHSGIGRQNPTRRIPPKAHF